MFYRKHNRVFAPVGMYSLTEQSHKDSCDINNILSQFKMTGIVSHINRSQPMYGDLPDYVDYQDALHTVDKGSEAFASLPSVVRDRYGNDPYKFLAALKDPAQQDQLREWGILKSKPAPAPSPAPEQPS
jgi:phage internal scaffolding protein